MGVLWSPGHSLSVCDWGLSWHDGLLATLAFWDWTLVFKFRLTWMPSRAEGLRTNNNAQNETKIPQDVNERMSVVYSIKWFL